MTKLKNKGYIYKVTDIITGQFYIGQRSSYTGTPEDDLGVHYFTSSKIVKPLFMNNTSEWQKEILYRDIQYSETLDDIEGYAIHKAINNDLCLNRYDPTTKIGFITAGRHQTEETKLKISEVRKGKPSPFKGKHFSEEGKKHISEALKGKHPSEEARRHMSEVRKGKPSPFKGKHHSDETRRKMSEALKGQIPWNKGKHISEKTKRKLAEANKGHKLSEEAKRKDSEAHKGKHHSDETKRKMSEAQRKRYSK